MGSTYLQTEEADPDGIVLWCLNHRTSGSSATGVPAQGHFRKKDRTSSDGRTTEVYRLSLLRSRDQKNITRIRVVLRG